MMRPKHGTAAWLPVLAMGLVAGLALPAGAGDGWKVFKHPQSGFQLSYPPDWSAMPSAEGVALFGPAADGLPIPMYVSVEASIKGAGGLASLEQFAKTMTADLMEGPANFRPISSMPVKLGGVDGWTFDYTTGITESYYEARLLAYGRKYTYSLKAATMANSSRSASERALLRKILLTFRPDGR